MHIDTMLVHKCCVCDYVDIHFADFIKNNEQGFDKYDIDSQMEIYEEWQYRDLYKMHYHVRSDVSDNHWIRLATFDYDRDVIKIYNPEILT